MDIKEEIKRILLNKYAIEAVEEMIKEKFKKVLEDKMEQEESIGEALGRIEYEELKELVEDRMEDEEKMELQFLWGFLKHLLSNESSDDV